MQECKKLKLVSKANLGQLLQALCHVDADKRIALSDWRQRPLPPALLHYSAQDVLHLQDIAAKLIQMLLDSGTCP